MNTYKLKTSSTISSQQFIYRLVGLIFALTCLFFWSPSLTFAAKMNLPTAAITSTLGQEFDVTVSLDTLGSKTTGADAIITFNPTYVEAMSVNLSSPYEHKFSHIFNDTGTLKLSATYTHVADSFQGVSPYATIRFRAKQVGSSPLAFVCASGNTNDTNILELQSGNDIVNCNLLNSTTINITTTSNNQNNQSNNNNNSTGGSNQTNPYTVPTCNNIPGSPTNFRVSYHSPSSLLLTWNHGARAQKYMVQYGESPILYQHGVGNMGYSQAFVIGALKPNTRYHFALQSVSDCGATSPMMIAQGATTRPIIPGRANILPTITPRPTLNTSPRPVGSPTPTTSPSPLVSPTSTPSPTPEVDYPGLTNLASNTQPLSEESTLYPTAVMDETIETEALAVEESSSLWDSFIITLLVPFLILLILAAILLFIWKRRRQDTMYQ